MKERLMVMGRRHWVADKDGKVLLADFDTNADARRAIAEMEEEDRKNGIYVWKFYTVVEGFLGGLKAKGYTVLDEVRLCTEI